MANSDHGIVKNEKAEDQPKDKERAQTVHRVNPDKSVSREATRDPKAGGSNNAAGDRPSRTGSAR
jgi:hypothetical protein